MLERFSAFRERRLVNIIHVKQFLLDAKALFWKVEIVKTYKQRRQELKPGSNDGERLQSGGPDGTAAVFAGQAAGETSRWTLRSSVCPGERRILYHCFADINQSVLAILIICLKSYQYKTKTLSKYWQNQYQLLVQKYKVMYILIHGCVCQTFSYFDFICVAHDATSWRKDIIFTVFNISAFICTLRLKEGWWSTSASSKEPQMTSYSRWVSEFFTFFFVLNSEPLLPCESLHRW